MKTRYRIYRIWACSAEGWALMNTATTEADGLRIFRDLAANSRYYQVKMTGGRDNAFIISRE